MSNHHHFYSLTKKKAAAAIENLNKMKHFIIQCSDWIRWDSEKEAYNFRFRTTLAFCQPMWKKMVNWKFDCMLSTFHLFALFIGKNRHLCTKKNLLMKLNKSGLLNISDFDFFSAIEILWTMEIINIFEYFIRFNCEIIIANVIEKLFISNSCQEYKNIFWFSRKL